MKVLDLFSGIGGFSLGLERAGMETVAFCEFDKKAQLVLKKHWPDVPIFDDVRKLTYGRLEECGLVGNSELYGRVATEKQGIAKKASNDYKKGQKQASKLAGTGKPRNGGRVGEIQPRNEAHTIDLICGGFPCQPFSVAGKQRGKEDDRHLWPEYFRLIQEIRPRWVIGENVAGLINMGLDQVLSDLEGEGYSCQTFIIPACAVNAPHRRDRVWIVANSDERYHDRLAIRVSQSRDDCQTLAHSEGERRECGETGKSGIDPQCEEKVSGWSGSRGNTDFWAVEPDVGRVADGIPRRLDRLKQLGNSVISQIVEQIARAIMEIENTKT